MTKMVYRTIWWAIVALYTALIFSTIGIASDVWDSYNAFMGGEGVFLVYAMCFIVGVGLLTFITYKRKSNIFRRYLMFFISVFAFLFINKISDFAVDKVHVIQYSIMAILAYNALKIDVNSYGIKLYVVGAIFCILAGALDEVLQGAFPNRYFDPKDILFNGISSIVTLLLIKISILKAKN